ncbi:MAG: hypothetical protein HKN33_10655 [Pyrinomonadaceae bacterium]|nr:hypothetical protein [Pyrinomonadaceae bacterium]
MRDLILTVFMIGLFATAAAAQFTVKLDVRANDRALEDQTRSLILGEFESVKDIAFSKDAKFGLTLEVIKRPIGENTADIYVSVVATSAASCVLALDSNGRVESRQGCREFLTLNTFVGRETELEEIAGDIASGFNSYVLEPLREVSRQNGQL